MLVLTREEGEMVEDVTAIRTAIDLFTARLGALVNCAEDLRTISDGAAH